MADPADGERRDGVGASPGAAGPRATSSPWLTERRRRVVAYGLVVLACVLALAASLTFWVQKQVLDTDRWVDTSSELLEQPEVRDALAVRLVEGLYDGPAVAQRLEARLPPALDGLAPPIAAGLQEAAVGTAQRLLARPAVLSLWEEANRAAHARLVDVIQGGGDTVSTEGGRVVLDLSPLVARLQEELGLGAGVSPQTTEITIVESDQLGAAQDAVHALDVLSPLLAVAVVALLLIGAYLARGFRRELVRAAALGLLAVGLVLLVVRRLVGDAVVAAVASDTGESTGLTVWSVATSILGDLALGLVALGIAGLVWAWLSGATRSARWVRRRIAPAMGAHPALVYGVVLIGALLLLAWGPTGAPRRLVGTLVIIALVCAGVEALRRQIGREGAGGASTPAAAAPPAA